MREVLEQCYLVRFAWSLPIHPLDSTPWYAVEFIRRNDVFGLDNWSQPIHSAERSKKENQEGKMEMKSEGSL